METSDIKDLDDAENPNLSHYLSDIDEKIKRMQSELNQEKQQNEDKKELIHGAMDSHNNAKVKICEQENQIKLSQLKM